MKSFESDLGETSQRIQTLLDGSKSIQEKLKIKRQSEVELEVLTKNITIDDELIAGIYQTPMNESFLHYTKILTRIKAFIQAQMSSGNTEIKALEEIMPVMKKLQDKMVGRIRQFLLQKLYSLNPNSNIQMLQQKILKYKPFYNILLDFNLDIADEIKTKYIDLISSFLVPNFKMYITSLLKLQAESATKNDLLGNPTKKVTQVSAGVFSLGSRGAGIISSKLKGDSAPIIPHIAAKENKKYHFERIFYSIHRVLLDTVAGEVSFHMGFFNADFFKAIFHPIITYIEDVIDSHISSSYDAISLLMMAIIVEKDLNIMNKRNVTNLDPYFAEMRMKLLTRFQHVLELNIESIKNAKVKDLGNFDEKPHYITRRYSEFIASIHVLMKSYNNEIGKRIVLTNMKTLSLNFDELLKRMSEVEVNNKMRKTLFLINNYDLLLEILTENSVSSFETDYFKEKLDEQVIECINLELSLYFSDMNEFIRKKTQNPKLKVEKEKITGLAKKFNTNWKLLLGKISQDIMRSFPNLRTGSNVLRSCYQQLFANYKRFQDIIKETEKEIYSELSEDFVPMSTLTYEVKQYETEFS